MSLADVRSAEESTAHATSLSADAALAVADDGDVQAAAESSLVALPDGALAPMPGVMEANPLAVFTPRMILEVRPLAARAWMLLARIPLLHGFQTKGQPIIAWRGQDWVARA